MNGSAIFVRGERTLPLSSRSHLPRASLDAHPYFAHAYPAEKEQTLGGGHGNVAWKSASPMSKNVRGYSLNKHLIYGWAVVILIFEILPFSFRYDLLEFLFAKIYVCISMNWYSQERYVTAITKILHLPRIRSCITELISKHLQVFLLFPDSKAITTLVN